MPVEGLPPTGKFRVVVEAQPPHGIAILKHNEPFRLLSWPNVQPEPPDDRPSEVATERLYWVDSGALAYAAGTSYPIEEKPQLCRHDERGHPVPLEAPLKTRSRNASQAR
jgi:hypothetical protein